MRTWGVESKENCRFWWIYLGQINMVFQNKLACVCLGIMATLPGCGRNAHSNDNSDKLNCQKQIRSAAYCVFQFRSDHNGAFPDTLEDAVKLEAGVQMARLITKCPTKGLRHGTFILIGLVGFPMALYLRIIHCYTNQKVTNTERELTSRSWMVRLCGIPSVDGLTTLSISMVNINWRLQNSRRGRT